MLDYIEENDFLAKANSGDLLLFKTRSVMGLSITRIITNSYYDHVAMIVKYPNDDDIYYIESVGSGVQFCRWSGLSGKIGAGKEYQKVVWRQVTLSDRTIIDSKIDIFVNEAYKKETSIAPSKFKR